MIYNNILLTVKNEADIENVRELLIEQVPLSREDRSLFILIEQWESQELLEAHRQAKSCQEVYIPKVLPLVERVPHPSDKVL